MIIILIIHIKVELISVMVELTSGNPSAALKAKRSHNWTGNSNGWTPLHEYGSDANEEEDGAADELEQETVAENDPRASHFTSNFIKVVFLQQIRVDDILPHVVY